MAAAKTLLRRAEPPPPMSPERQALADAIAIRDERLLEIGAATRALAAGEEAVALARSRHEAALQGIETARKAAAAHLVAAEAGKPSAAPQTIQAARAAEIVAAAALAAAQDTEAALEAEVATAGKIDLRQQLVAEAARKVLAASAPIRALIAEVENLQAQMARKGGELHWLLRAGAVPASDRHFGSSKTHEQLVAERHEYPPINWDLPKGAGASWQRTIDRLMIDATAEVP